MKKWLYAAVAVVGLSLIASAIMIQWNSQQRSSPAHNNNQISNQGGYSEIAQPVPVVDAGRSEVLEYFWFGCPIVLPLNPISTPGPTQSLITSVLFAKLPRSILAGLCTLEHFMLRELWAFLNHSLSRCSMRFIVIIDR